ncbi:Na+/H+ antiporter subunit E [Nonomuraea sp. SYSU D8015]|uniref:Na+/H+ antiporter subunit E n=1 Tax=Nonomuraea sp. SYSU D8015 TaxID=2593644 RepID=UPI00166147DD|nr:Na+/H+ antiporter subunit E [Nonomuraea sp. SYSU D8015]
MSPRLALIGWLTLVWVMLWGDPSAGTALGGIAAALVVTWLLPLPVLDPGIRLRPVALARFVAWFGWDMVLSTARVVWWVIRPGPPPTLLVRVELRTSSESMIALIMAALANVPGSIVVDAYVAERCLLLHVLGLPGDAAEAVRAHVAGLESRVVAAFGTRPDREELG